MCGVCIYIYDVCSMFVCVCTSIWYVCVCGVLVFIHGQCYGMYACVVCGVCVRCKRDTEANGQRMLWCSGHVRKLGLVLKLPCLLGESRAKTTTSSGCPLWTVEWISRTSLSYNGTTQAPTHSVLLHLRKE